MNTFVPLTMRKRRYNIFTLLLGCLVACTIAFSQFFPEPERPTVTTEQQEKNGSEASYISLPSFSLPSPLNVQASLDPVCLFEILFEENKPQSNSKETRFLPEKLLVILFRVIISPNAP